MPYLRGWNYISVPSIIQKIGVHVTLMILGEKYKYHTMKRYFDNTVKKDSSPKWYTGKLLFEMVKNIQAVFGKGTIKRQKRKKNPTSTHIPFRKQSIFFKCLPYWKDLETFHSFDLMHVTKNVFDNIIGTLLDMPRKMKDGLKLHNDLVQFGLRIELHPKLRPNGKHYLPPASYSLTVEEKKEFCQCLCGVRVPRGFSSNISKLVSMKDLSMFGYNSHNYHWMMMVFLPVTIRAIKQMHMKVLITCLCYFFNTVSQKLIGRKELVNLKAYIIETMCMLEMCVTSPKIKLFICIQIIVVNHRINQILKFRVEFISISKLRSVFKFSFKYYCCPDKVVNIKVAPNVPI
jgi:hypothetical protein